jgi:hypothetical protein
MHPVKKLLFVLFCMALVVGYFYLTKTEEQNILQSATSQIGSGIKTCSGFVKGLRAQKSHLVQYKDSRDLLGQLRVIPVGERITLDPASIELNATEEQCNTLIAKQMYIEQENRICAQISDEILRILELR